MRPSMSEIRFGYVSDLGTVVNDNVTFGGANPSLGWCMESWMVHGGAETICMMRDTLRVVVSLSPVILQARVDCVHN